MGVLKSRTRWISPRKWFPSHDPIACAVARLCILREDLYVEYLAMAAGEITITLTYPEGKVPFDKPPGLDDNGAQYRRIYFLRASLHTLHEVYNAVSGLRNNREFRRLYRAQDAQAFAEFTTFVQGLDRNLKELKRVRNALGGHVSREAVKKALETIDYSETGKCDIGRTIKDSHYGFATTLCSQIFLQDIPPKDRMTYHDEIMGLNLEAMGIVNKDVNAYILHNKLL